MTLAEVQVKRSEILMDRLGPDPDIFSMSRMKGHAGFASCACAFKSSELIACLECTSNQKVSYVFVALK